MKRIVSKKSHTTAAKVTSELNIHLKVPVSTKIVRREFHQSNIHGTAAIATPLTTENNAKGRKRWWNDNKIWMSDDWKYVIWSDELYALPNIRPGLCLENVHGSL